AYFGLVLGKIAAKTDVAYQALLERFVTFYRERLHNETWGEQVKVRGNNELGIMLAFQGITAKAAEAALQPLRDWVSQHPSQYTAALKYAEIPGNKMWDLAYARQNMADFVVPDRDPGHPDWWYWWAGNQDEVATYWYAYQSRWLPLPLFEGVKATQL